VSQPFSILLSSAGRRVALVEILRRTLARLDLVGRVVAADRSWAAPALHAADEGILVPPCSDPAFVPTALDVCRRAGVRLVVPTIDPELPVYAAHAAAFREAGVVVAVSSPEAVAIAGDKERTAAWLAAAGLPTVRQARPEAVLAGNGWRYPVVVKPRWGSGSIGVGIARSAEELRLLAEGRDVVVQSVARGIEYSIDVLVLAGRVVSAVPRRRVEVRAGESSKGVTVRHPGIEAAARAAAERLPGAYGPLTVQAFHDPEADDVRLIEVNPRFGGGFPLSYEAGADHPRWLIEDVLGLPSTASADAWRAGVAMLRYDAAVFLPAERAGL
jgi:carbamoyl-phosphate synthase large subunit